MGRLTGRALKTARAYELLKLAIADLVYDRPDVIPHIQSALKMITPVRNGEGAMRVFGRTINYHPSAADTAKMLCKNYWNGTRRVRINNPEVLNGIEINDEVIDMEGDYLSIKEPPDERNKQILVIIPQAEELSTEAKALGILTESPGLTHEQIAEKIGVTVRHLARLPNYMAARTVLKQSRKKYQRISTEDEEVE